MIAVLMVVGFVVTFVVAYLARFEFKFFGWRFVLDGGAGGIVVHVGVWFYARFMNRLDHEYGFEEISSQAKEPSSR